jgi:uncharacterized protein (DUF1330 family)
MAAYLIADIRVINQQRYQGFRVMMRDALLAHGGRYLARGQVPEVVQGGWAPPRMVLVEFADMATIDNMLNGQLFKQAEEVRVNCAMLDMIAVEGLSHSLMHGNHEKPAYAIADTRVVNRPAFEEYRLRIHQAVREYGGRYLVVNEAARTLTGNWAPPLLTMMEFPSRELAMQSYTETRYQGVRDLGNNAAMIEMVLLEGFTPDTDS